MKQLSVDNPFFKFSLLAISFTLMIRLTISPALVSMAPAFPDVSQDAMLNMISIISLFAIPTAFIGGLVVRKVRKKPIVLLGLALYAIAGVIPMFTTDFNLIVVSRCFAGLGIGFIIPMATGLLSDFYSGEQRNRMLGFQNTAVAIGNLITFFLAGVLAVFSWHLSFGIYALIGIVFFIVLFGVHEPERKQYEGEDKKTINKGVVFVSLCMFGYAIIYFSFFGYLSYLILQNNLGDSSTAGLAQALMTAASLVLGFVFVKYTKLTRKFNVTVAILLNAAGCALLGFAPFVGVGMVYAGMLVSGIGFGTLMPTSMMIISDKAPKSSITFANGLLMIAINLGTAVSPLILGLVSTDAGAVFRFCAICTVAGAVVAAIMAFVKIGKAKKLKPAEAA